MEYTLLSEIEELFEFRLMIDSSIPFGVKHPTPFNLPSSTFLRSMVKLPVEVQDQRARVAGRENYQHLGSRR